MLLRLTASLKGALRYDRDAGVFVSFCPTMNIYSQGRSEKEAIEALTSAVWLFISTCLEQGTLERTIKKVGFVQISGLRMVSPSHYMDEFIAIENYDEAFQFEVPINLVAQGVPCRV